MISKFTRITPTEVESLLYFWRTTTNWQDFSKLGKVLMARSYRFRQEWEESLEAAQYAFEAFPDDRVWSAAIMQEIRIRIDPSEVERVLSLGEPEYV